MREPRLKRPILLAIRGYQRALSPALGVRCRYEPSCSHYAYQAVEAHGTLRGSWLALRRLARCHPWSKGGYDPVPAANIAHPEIVKRRT